MNDEAVRKAQIKLFRERLKPVFVMIGEGCDVVRGARGFKRPVTDEVRWSDIIRFEHSKIADIGVWDAFAETFPHFLLFDKNPLENKQAFIQELHDLIEFLNENRTVPNGFTIWRDVPTKSNRIEIARGNEKFESERFPRVMKVKFKLVWVVKA